MTLKQRVGKLVFRHLPISRFLFDQLRVEMNAVACSVKNSFWPPNRRTIQRLRKMDGLRANIACGPQVIPGFVNLDLNAATRDVVEWDCRRRLPFSSESVAGIRVEQFVEHLETREELPAFLADCRRVLRHGGVLRVIVPDAERYLRAYCRDDLEGFRELKVPVVFPEDLPTRMDLVNHIFHQWSEHRWGYDFETLEHRLKSAGFAKIQRMSFSRSLDEPLAFDRPYHAPYSLYVDAVK